jgi:hypothetical protein
MSNIKIRWKQRDGTYLWYHHMHPARDDLKNGEGIVWAIYEESAHTFSFHNLVEELLSGRLDGISVDFINVDGSEAGILLAYCLQDDWYHNYPDKGAT